MYYYSSYWLLILPAFIFAMIAQYMVNSAYKKYSKIETGSMMSGADVARKVLMQNGVSDISINKIQGNLTDHYDPTKSVVNLSEGVYEGRSIAAIAIALHEIGHVLQDVNGYSAYRLRRAIIPVTMFCSQAAVPVFILGLIFSSQVGGMLMDIGIILFMIAALFQIVTLPVEFNASKRAKELILANGFLSLDEMSGVNSTLNAAALTYVAALAVTLTQLLRLVLLRGDRRR